jgi:LacI family repressor for deo operon, udp, cdd, tsx, nupC, and nupG
VPRVIDYIHFTVFDPSVKQSASGESVTSEADDPPTCKFEEVPRTARIRDVARLAAVSTATVSRALATPERVSPEARARVLEAIARVGYVPNPMARSLRSQKSRMVLVVLPNLDNIFFSKILRGIEETLFEAGYGMIIGDLDGSPGKEAHFAAFTAAGQVDGAILLNGHLFGQTRDGRGQPARTNVPLIALCEAIPGADIPQIEVDNHAAARGMTKYLASLGHRRIAYVCGPEGNVLEHERFRGYRDGLSDVGIAFDADLVWPGDYTLGAGASAGRDIAGRRPRPTAVFCSNDEMAIGLMRSLMSAGVAVPGDISVAGFDDIEFAGMVEPSLTTIRQPRRDLGRTGALVLLDILRGRSVASRVQLTTKLVVRRSTAPTVR